MNKILILSPAFFLLIGWPGAAQQKDGSEEVKELQWHTDETAARDEAKKLGRPVFLFFTADWCHWCHVMEEQTLTTPQVVKLLSEKFVLFKADYDQRRDLVARFRVKGVPAMVVGDPDLNHTEKSGGFMPLDVFTAWIEDAMEKVSPEAIAAAEEKARQFVIETRRSFRFGLTEQQYRAIRDFYKKCADRDPACLEFAKHQLAEEVEHNPGRFCRFLKSDKLHVRILTCNAFAKLYGSEFDYDPWDRSEENLARLDAFLEKKNVSSLLEDLIDFSSPSPD